MEKRIYLDGEGSVFGYPSIIEVDLARGGSERVPVEAKSGTPTADVYELANVGGFARGWREIKP